MERIDLLCWGELPTWSNGEARRLPTNLRAAAAVIDDVAASAEARWLLLWDPLLPLPDESVLGSLVAGRADAWHGGLLAGLGGEPEEHDYIHPIWPLARNAGTEVEAVSWRLSLGSVLVRTEVLRALGGLDRAFRGSTGAGLELGRRLIERGAVVENAPGLVPAGRVPAEPLSEHDRFVFLRRTFGRKWVRYAAARRVGRRGHLLRTVRAFRTSGAAVAANPRPKGSSDVLTRPSVAIPSDPRITVVMPTLGRYPLVEGVLDQLCEQTVPPHQVVVVDQNEPSDEAKTLYDSYQGRLPLEVVFQDERGQWISRNEAVRRATGDWIAFVDDDSALVADFLERHLEGLHRYRADLSTGASLAEVGAPIPENYAFFRVADQWDSGNGMCHRSLLERFGLFDEQFDRQRRGDAEFGLRVQLGGGLVIHTPGAIRTHLKAETGGLRTYGSWDGFRHRDRGAPLPLPSMLYYTLRYHSPRQVREDLLIGVSQSIVPYHLKRRASPRQWAGFVGIEMLHVPSTIRRIRMSRRLAEQMVAEGPKVPELAPR